jgi:hypothetical protein
MNNHCTQFMLAIKPLSVTVRGLISGIVYN